MQATLIELARSFMAHSIGFLMAVLFVPISSYFLVTLITIVVVWTMVASVFWLRSEVFALSALLLSIATCVVVGVMIVTLFQVLFSGQSIMWTTQGFAALFVVIAALQVQALECIRIK